MCLLRNSSLRESRFTWILKKGVTSAGWRSQRHGKYPFIETNLANSFLSICIILVKGRLRSHAFLKYIHAQCTTNSLSLCQMQNTYTACVMMTACVQISQLHLVLSINHALHHLFCRWVKCKHFSAGSRQQSDLPSVLTLRR